MKSLREWVKRNRAEIDRVVRSGGGMDGYKLNDKDRADWVANDEGLYNWARREGVEV